MKKRECAIRLGIAHSRFAILVIERTESGDRAHRVVHGEPDPALRGRPLRGRLTRLDHTAFRLRALLVENLLHRSAETLANANWPKPGSTEARLELTIRSKALCFMMFPFGRPLVFFFVSVFSHRAAHRFYAVFLFLVFLLFFCCAFTIGRKVCVRHAAIAISIVDSSVHLKERIKTVIYSVAQPAAA